MQADLPVQVMVQAEVSPGALYYFYRSGKRCLGISVIPPGRDQRAFLELQPLDDAPAGPTVRDLGYPDTEAAAVLQGDVQIVPKVPEGLADIRMHPAEFVRGRLVVAVEGTFLMASYGDQRWWVNIVTGEMRSPIAIIPQAVFDWWTIERVRQGCPPELLFEFKRR